MIETGGQQPLQRVEDHRLLTGAGRYVADLAVPGCLEAAFTRSDVAHGALRAVQTSEAAALSGIAAVLTANDLIDVGDTPPMLGDNGGRPWPALATDRVRHVGEAIAIAVGHDRYRAEDAAAAVAAEITPLQPVPTIAASFAAADPLYEGTSNVALEQEFGARVSPATWENAHAVVEADYRQQLLAPTPLEARAILVEPADGGGLTVWCSHQFPHGLRGGLATALGLGSEQVRVIVPDAGGAFGSKSPTYPEYIAVAAAAIRLHQPVRWIEDRSEALLAGSRGRGQDQHVRMAADSTGRILAIDVRVDADIGAHPLGGGIPMQTGLAAAGPYTAPEVHAQVRSVLTTTAPTFAYRGAGRPEAAYAVERTVDLLAGKLDMDPIELRRPNFIDPEQMPYETPTGRHYDSGDYHAAFEHALELLDLRGWRHEQARRRADPDAWPLGIGVACYVERSGGEPGILEEFGSVEACVDGTFLGRVGTSSTGQSHETVFGRLIADVLDVDPSLVRISEADTGKVAEGHGSFASRSMQMGGAALHEAAHGLVAEVCVRAAHAWGLAPDAVRWQAGMVVIAGHDPMPAAKLVGDGEPLRYTHQFTSPPAFPYGSYAAVVEVDPELGTVHVLRLVAVDDYGTVVDETVARGQTLGSVTQGVGQALYEDVPLDADGSPCLAMGLLDYLLPTAAEVPPLVLGETSVPNPHNPIGAKGAGEAGCIGVPPAIVNAVANALPGADPAWLRLPLTPETVWQAMHA